MSNRGLRMMVYVFLLIGLTALSAEAAFKQYWDISGFYYMGDDTAPRYEMTGEGVMTANDGAFNKDADSHDTNFDDLFVSFNFRLHNDELGFLDGYLFFSVIRDMNGSEEEPTQTFAHDYVGANIEGVRYLDLVDVNDVTLYYGPNLSFGDGFEFDGFNRETYEIMHLQFSKTGEEHYPVPEPASIILLGSGCLTLLGVRRKRKIK